MPLRPFPLPYRIGIDICKLSRLRKLLGRDTASSPSRERTDRFIKRCFHGVEHDQIHALTSQNEARLIEFLAGRWAAKEAVIKASNRRLFMKDIIIWRSENGPAAIILDDHDNGKTSGPGPSTVEDLKQLHGQIIQVSISHEEDHAVAIAIVPNEDSRRPIN